MFCLIQMPFGSNLATCLFPMQFGFTIAEHLARTLHVSVAPSDIEASSHNKVQLSWLRTRHSPETGAIDQERQAIAVPKRRCDDSCLDRNLVKPRLWGRSHGDAPVLSGSTTLWDRSGIKSSKSCWNHVGPGDFGQFWALGCIKTDALVTCQARGKNGCRAFGLWRQRWIMGWGQDLSFHISGGL